MVANSPQVTQSVTIFISYSHKDDDLCEELKSIVQEMSDCQSEGIAFVNIGDTQCKLKQYSESSTNNQVGLRIFREIGDRAGEAEALKNLAEVYRAIGQMEEGRSFCQQALKLAIELGIPLIPILFEATQNKEGQGGYAPLWGLRPHTPRYIQLHIKLV